MTTQTDTHLRWAYMDHWRIDTSRGQISPNTSLRHFDLFKELFGALQGCRAFMQDRGIEPVAAGMMSNSWYVQNVLLAEATC